MAVQLESIKNNIKSKIILTSIEARNSATIEEVLDKQTSGIVEAEFKSFMSQATVEGGICSLNGPITQGKIV